MPRPVIRFDWEHVDIDFARVLLVILAYALGAALVAWIAFTPIR